MDSPFEYAVYFPAAGEAADPADCEAIRQRTHFYLGETVHFLVLLRKGTLLRAKQMGDLFAVASVAAQFDGSRLDSNNSDEEEREAEDNQGDIFIEHHRRRSADATRKFVECRPLLNHNNARPSMEPVKSTPLSEEQVSFRLAVTLDKLPVNTLQAKIVVSVWEQDEDHVEVSERGYLALLQLCSPARTFREDNKFKAQVSATLNVLPPPGVGCQHLTVCGKHLTFLKVSNSASREELCITDVKILPNYNSSYLPMMPDGSVLVVDNVCHQSAEVTTAAFRRVDRECSRLPSTLGSLEEHNFLFRLQLQDQDEQRSSQGLEVALLAVMQWRPSTLPPAKRMATFYSLPSIRLNRPGLVLSASCPSAVGPGHTFPVKYTLVNDLRDFLSVRLRWNAQGAGRRHRDPEVTAVVCRSPLSHLGRCRKGSSISFTVAFQIFGTGLFELSQHMKMQLQMTAWPEEPRSPQRRPAPWAGGAGRSLSFSRQPPPPPPFTAQHARTGSVTARPSDSPPDAAPEQSLVAKRQCQVFVLNEGHFDSDIVHV